MNPPFHNKIIHKFCYEVNEYTIAVSLLRRLIFTEWEYIDIIVSKKM